MARSEQTSGQSELLDDTGDVETDHDSEWEWVYDEEETEVHTGPIHGATSTLLNPWKGPLLLCHSSLCRGEAGTGKAQEEVTGKG